MRVYIGGVPRTIPHRTETSSIKNASEQSGIQLLLVYTSGTPSNVVSPPLRRTRKPKKRDRIGVKILHVTKIVLSANNANKLRHYIWAELLHMFSNKVFL